MLSRLFRAHGQFCASRPWEIIVGTMMLTVCVMSMSLFAGNRKICSWSIRSSEKENDLKSADAIVLMSARCLAIVYLYLQFRKLHRLGSKYLLGLASIFTIFASFVFSIGIANLLRSDLTGLNEALPFFLLLIDLSKACALARFALGSSSQEAVVENIGNGMAVVGPLMTLDAIVETLVIGIGMLSGVKTLETTCCFGCLSIVASYLAFVVFFPACLALILELTRGSRPLLHVRQLAKLWEDEEEKPNPVAQKVKVIMCGGLAFVYARSRLAVSAENSHLALKLPIALSPDATQTVLVDISIWKFYISQMSSLSFDYILMLLLAFILALKYVYFDSDEADTVGSSDSTEEKLTRDTVDNAAIIHDGELLQIAGKLSAETNERLSETEKSSEADSLGSSRSHFYFENSSDDDEVIMVSSETQTDTDDSRIDGALLAVSSSPPRSLEQCRAVLKSEDGAKFLTDDEVLMLVQSKDIPGYNLENILESHERGVLIRRRTILQYLANMNALEKLPFRNYDYKYVDGSCCENVIGYVPVPVGFAGPLLLNGNRYVVPMATTEGCLVASTNRGCRALSSGAGVKAVVTRDGMTRAPVIRFATSKRASEVKSWLESPDNYGLVSESFDSTSRFARLKNLTVVQVARSLYVRFTAHTGDAMGMNMLSKGTEKVLFMLQEKFFPDMEVISLSGNFCTDKKPSAINWIAGRGKSVIAEAVVSKDVVKNILKTSSSALVDLNISKNLIGSAVAGSIGGFNAHAANIVTAIYIATGQDPAQTVTSSNCITIMEPFGPENEDLYISCTMPSIEVGTIGGGTILPPQAACLDILGIRGSNSECPGLNACTLATVVCAAVMAGELSVMSALAAGHLVKSHLKHNRSVLNMAPTDDKTLCHGGSQMNEVSSCFRTVQ